MKIFSSFDFEIFLKYFFGYLLLFLPVAVLVVDGRALLAETTWQLKDKFESLHLPVIQPNATSSQNFVNLTASSSMVQLPTGSTVVLESYVYIPKIKVKAEIVFPDTVNSKELLSWLEKGVIHYPDSAEFGSVSSGSGVSIILGHSSAYPWYRGSYGSVFALLEKLEAGDEVMVVSSGKKYLYRVSGSKVVVPKDFKVENPDGKPHLWLMSCWPVRSNKLRMVVAADLIKTESL